MAVIKYHPDLSNIKDLQNLIRYTSQAINQIHDIIGGSIEFDQNILSQTVSVKFNTANTEQFVFHNLNKKGLRYIVIDKSVSCDIYHNSARDTLSQICLASTVATTVTLILI
jgi:sarcosine oxidase delta subunit